MVPVNPYETKEKEKLRIEAAEKAITSFFWFGTGKVGSNSNGFNCLTLIFLLLFPFLLASMTPLTPTLRSTGGILEYYVDTTHYW